MVICGTSIAYIHKSFIHKTSLLAIGHLVEPNRSYPSRKRQIKITGIILPTDWDEDGNPVSIAIFAPKDRTYLIDLQHGQGIELLKLLREKISATGPIKEFAGYAGLITVMSYKHKKVRLPGTNKICWLKFLWHLIGLIFSLHFHMSWFLDRRPMVHGYYKRMAP